MNREQYQAFLRAVAVGMAILLLVVSAQFSMKGFDIRIPEMAWIGKFLAIAIIGIELVWNKEGFGHNMTILVGGMFAYLYGVATNVIGIMGAQGGNWDDWGGVGFALVLGIFLEILPEPLLLWGLVGHSEEDVLTNLFMRKQGTAIENPAYRPPQQQQQNNQNQNKPQQNPPQNQNNNNRGNGGNQKQFTPPNGGKQQFVPKNGGNGRGPEEMAALLKQMQENKGE